MCSGKLVKLRVPSLSIGDRFIPTILKPISRPTAVTSERTSTLECLPCAPQLPCGSRQQERCNIKIKILYTRAAVNSCIVIYRMMCTLRVTKTYHLGFTTNYSEKQYHIKIFFKPFSEQKATGGLSIRVRMPLNK